MRSFSSWLVDFAIFEDASTVGSWEHVLTICEFKAPDLQGGVSQPETYLARGPRARVGFWTNGIDDVRAYKLPDDGFLYVKGRAACRSLTRTSPRPRSSR